MLTRVSMLQYFLRESPARKAASSRDEAGRNIPEEVELLSHHSEAGGLTEVGSSAAHQIARVEKVLHLAAYVLHCALRCFPHPRLILEVHRRRVLAQFLADLQQR